ncbi:type II toxin-antitoxin system VapC family toxin [Catalinimonas sp. 4WD22]|uniref:type II toxin-antitoxin system VapC family toxin n=1 Tax=Catalinimonas locisalis TaxID=3133978 RepID=UPI0031015F8E
MSKAILFDTNVLVYAKDQPSSFHDKAVQFLDNYEGEIYTTSKNLTEYLVATTRGDTPISPLSEALEDIDDFINVFSILYPDKKSYQKLLQLLTQHQHRGKKIHDYEIAAIALANNIKQIATFNEKDFSGIAGVQVINPAHHTF